jgi:hypothetical protein
MSNALSKSNYVKGIREAFETSMMNLQGACELYVQAIDEDWRNKEFIQKELEHVIPKTAWAGMEQAGRGTLDRRLTFDRGGKNARYIKKLPLSDQTKIMDGEKIELLATDGNPLLVDALKVGKAQAEQLFDGDAIRTIDAQRAFLEAEERGWEMVEKVHSLAERYRVMGARVIVPAACELNKGDLLAMLAEIK